MAHKIPLLKEENDTVESAKPATEEKVTEATSPKEEKEVEVVSPKEEKTEKTAAEVNEKEPTVAEVNTEKPAVLEEHTAEANQNKPVSDDKAKEEKNIFNRIISSYQRERKRRPTFTGKKTKFQ